MTDGPTRYERPRDEALHLMAIEGWANEQSGHLDSPSGWFARISNPPEEVECIDDAFGDDLPDGVTTAEILGHFLLTERRDERFQVETYPSERQVTAAYRILEQVFEDWRREGGDA